MRKTPEITSADIKFSSYPFGDTSKKEYFERRMAPHVVRKIARKLRERYGTYTSLTTHDQEFSNDLSKAGKIGTVHAPAALMRAIETDTSIERYHIFSIWFKAHKNN